jgi:hypothetical protein
MELREEIKNAFPMSGAPRYRLSDAIIEDDYGDDSYAFKEDWGTWEEIENWQLVKSDVFFSYAPIDAAIYILPRFMLFVLDEIEGKLQTEYQGYSAGESAVWFIQRLKKRDYRGSSLTTSQVSVIENFLSYIYKDCNYRVTVDVGQK